MLLCFCLQGFWQFKTLPFPDQRKPPYEGQCSSQIWLCCSLFFWYRVWVWFKRNQTTTNTCLRVPYFKTHLYKHEMWAWPRGEAHVRSARSHSRGQWVRGQRKVSWRHRCPFDRLVSFKIDGFQWFRFVFLFLFLFLLGKPMDFSKRPPMHGGLLNCKGTWKAW